MSEDFEKGAFEAITRLPPGADDPRAAGKTVAQLLSRASHAAKDNHHAIVSVSKGVMAAMKLKGGDLPEMAVQMLKSLSNMTLMTRVDPQDIMTWVMEGIAEASFGAASDVRGAIGDHIESQFQGAGEVFAQLCEKAIRKDAGLS